MIIVMPAGHTTTEFRIVLGTRMGHDAFNEDLVSVIVPYVDSYYRTLTDRDHRAIAGLSMGGAQTLAVSLDDSADFAWVGVFSSGWFPNMMKDEEDTDLAKYHASGKPFRLFWVGIGQNDFFLQSSHATVALLNKYGIKTDLLERLPELVRTSALHGSASPLGKQVLMGKSNAWKKACEKHLCYEDVFLLC